ncbi:MAG: hypothetical protein ACLP8S_18340, partial [Solirubrobacteraceae bacterium]
LGSSDELSLSSTEIQEIDQEAAEFGLTPGEFVELIEEEEAEAADSLPAAEGQGDEQELVQEEEQQAEQTMQDTMNQAESFDKTLKDD